MTSKTHKPKDSDAPSALQRRSIGKRWRTAVTLLLALCLATCGIATAQENDDRDEAELLPPPAERVELVTTDGVTLVGRYYEVAQPGQDTPVVLMLGDEGESHTVFDELAEYVRSAAGPERVPASVLALAPRGQGDSTQVMTPSGRVEDVRGIELTETGVRAMIRRDLAAARKFLVDKNDSGAFNLNRLTYFGVGLGALVATHGAAIDWSYRDLATGKQGRDVKALVLVSPPWSAYRVGALDALRGPGVADDVAILLMYGARERRAERDAERIVRQLQKSRPEATDTTISADGVLPDLLVVPGETALQGSTWLKQGGRDAADLIVRFVYEHAVKPDHPWSRRRLR